jgi:hypothetical protein
VPSALRLFGIWLSAAAAELTNTGENTLTSQIYAEPNTRNDSGDGATRPDAQYSVATEQSTQLNNTTGHIDAITNAEYFLTTTVNVVTEVRVKTVKLFHGVLVLLPTEPL